MAGFEDLHVLPADWQAREGYLAPGDLRHFAPEGFGFSGPLIVRPWDTLEGSMQARSYYGLESRGADPIRSAPSTLPQGGTVYFDRYDAASGFAGVLRLLAMEHVQTRYAVFLASAEDTVEARYLDQMRIVDYGALSHLYGVSPEVVAALPDQNLGLREAIYAFLDHQTAKWNRSGRPFGSSELAGTLGGDGDWAKEALAFGLMIENGYWQVFRVWSRPWLVTK